MTVGNETQAPLKAGDRVYAVEDRGGLRVAVGTIAKVTAVMVHFEGRFQYRSGMWIEDAIRLARTREDAIQQYMRDAEYDIAVAQQRREMASRLYAQERVKYPD